MNAYSAPYPMLPILETCPQDSKSSRSRGRDRQDKQYWHGQNYWIRRWAVLRKETGKCSPWSRRRKEGQGRLTKNWADPQIFGKDPREETTGCNNSICKSTESTGELLSTRKQADRWPQRYQALIPGTCKCYLTWEKGLCRCDWIKDQGMREQSGWSAGP